MVRNKLAAAIAAIGALQAGLVSALGMGDFSLNSALNQPLDAEIRLLNIADLDASQVLVKMASPADFSNAGVSRDFFLTNVKFSVEVDGKGSGIIRVTTRQPVVEPYLNFLVEAHWPSGRMLREFTVLLDLPVFSDSAAQAVTQPVASSRPSAAATPVSTPVRQAPAARQVQSRRDDDSSQPKAGEQYRVKNDDTLWEIALNSRPGADLSVQQTMLGIQRLNPSAFVKGNINRLKAGSVLRLPTRDQISITDRQAIGEVANHNRAWKQGDDSVAPTTDVQLDATESSAAAEPAYADGARLSIAASADGDSSGFSEGEGVAGSVGGSALQDSLASAQENLDKSSMENQDLQSRLSDMESKLATLQRLIELKDDQLAALQLESATDTNNLQPMAGSTSADAAATADSVAGMDAKPKPELEPKSARPVSKPAEQSLLDQMTSNPLYAGGAGLLILAIAAIVLMRRRKSEETEDESDSVFDEPDIEAVSDFTELSSDTVGPIEDEPAEDVDTELLVAELESEIAAANAEEQATTETEAASPTTTGTAIESETGDVIAEADIYVAYGRYQQAIDLLRTGAEQEPERSDLQLKLLEVYIETRDKPAFQQQFKVLQGQGNPAAIEQVKEMLSTVDGVSGWLDGISEDTSRFTDADMDADLIEGEAGLAADDDSLQLDDIDLTLDEDLLAVDQELNLDTDLELDLDLDEANDANLDLELDLDAASTADDVELDLDIDDDLMLDLSELDDVPAAAAENDSFDLEEDLLQDSDAGSESHEEDKDKTVQYHVSELQAQLDADAGDNVDLQNTDLQNTDSLDLDELSFDESLQFDEDLSANDLAAEGDLLAAGTAAAEGSSSSDEFDLDLDEELDLESLADTDLGDLEAEFGDLGSTPTDDVDSDSFATVELDDIGEDFDMEAIAESMAGQDSSSIGGLELDLDASNETAEEATVEYTLDDVAAELAANDQAAADSSDQPQAFDSLSDSEEDVDDFDFLADTDEVATKLDLARAYIDMGDSEGAKDILDEVLAEGSEQQIQEANALVEKID